MIILDKQSKKPIRVVFFTAGKNVPSARFRILCYQSYLKKRSDIIIKILPSIPSINFHEHVFFKKLGIFANFFIFFGFFFLFIRRFFEVLFFCPFYNIIYIQKPFFPGKLYPFCEMLICKIKKNVIFDFDDAIYGDHQKKSNFKYSLIYKIFKDKDCIKKIIKNSSHIVVGNKNLAKYAQQFNSRVTIIPTSIDVNYYKPLKVKSKEKLIIGWVGTSGNLSYLESLRSVFLTLKIKYEFIIKIVCNPVQRKIELDGCNVEFVNWTKDNELNEILSFDIGIMPLENTEWTRGKCGFKILQYMACGLPVIASPVGVNAEIIQNTENGVLAEENSEWLSKLGSLISDAELRNFFGKNGRAFVTKNYSSDKIFPLLVEIIKKCAAFDSNLK